MLESLASEARPRISDFDNQGMANLAWSFALLWVKDFRMHVLKYSGIIRTVQRCDVQGVSNAFQIIFPTAPCQRLLIGAVLYGGSSCPSRAIPQNISNPAWAFSPLVIVIVPLLDALSAKAIPPLTAATAQDIGNTVWAYSTLCVVHEPLLKG